jgi:hypothetical protein
MAELTKVSDRIMNRTTLIGEFLEVPNALALLGIAVALVTFVAGWWFFYSPRKIGAKATASLPLFWSDGNDLPFVVYVTNINTRQFKINAVGFKTFGRYTNRRKSCTYQLTLGSGLLRTDKLLITEGDSTEMRFDGIAIADQLTHGVRGANMRLTSPELEIWLYLTHGIKVPVESDPRLCAKIIAYINEASARTA